MFMGGIVVEKARLNGYIDRSLFKEAKIQAVKEDISLSALVEKCLYLYLRQGGRDGGRRQDLAAEKESS